MGELWDIYDINKNKTGKTAQRDVDKLKEGEYHLVVAGIIINSDNQILISRRAKHKEYGLMWECSGGSVLKGETSLEGIIRELREELGINVTKKEAILFKETRKDEDSHYFKDFWLIKKNVNLQELNFSDGEAIEAKWVTIEEFIEMFDKKEIIPKIEFGLEDYKKVIEISKKTGK